MGRIKVKNKLAYFLLIAALSVGPAPATPNGGTLTLPTGKTAESIIIEDTGGGITENEMERIFDPFFTTREKGAGLGLSIARKLVGQHEGKLVAENSSAGAVFKMVLKKTEGKLPLVGGSKKIKS